jgi:hypothetical protein
MPYLNADIPPFWATLDEGFLHDSAPTGGAGGLLVEVFAVTSIPRRCLMFSVMSEMGSQHARVPIHYLRAGELATAHPLDWLQLWDCFSPYFSVTRHDYLKNARCTVILKDKKPQPGRYLWTIDWCQGPDHQLGYAEMAAGHKCGHVIALDSGQLACQPNNRVIWHDGGAFVGKPLSGHEKWRAFSQEFSCEAEGWKWSAGEDELMYYQFERREP